MEREELIRNLLEGKISLEDLEKHIQDPEELNDLKMIVQQSAKLNVAPRRSRDEAWSELSEKLVEKKQPARQVRLWIPLSIAATITLLIVSYFLLTQSNEVTTERGEHLAYTFDDGSRVTLNADSKISFHKFSSADDRSVNLIGEAFFEVTRGPSFTVHCTKGVVNVLGTSFNVIDRDGNFSVSCFSGSVNVTVEGSKSVVINAGESTHLVNGELSEPSRLDEQKEASWRRGEFYFDNVPLESVIDELERQFSVDIIYRGAPGRKYVGYFDNKKLDEALQLVFTPMGLTFRKEKNKVFVE